MKNSPVGDMFARIAGVYDLLNHVLSLGVDRHWRKCLARHTRADKTGKILDLAAGTLDVALAVLKSHPAAIISAVDFCPQMLKKGSAKLNSPELAFRVLPTVGDALAIPARDNAFDSVTMAFGIRNIPDRKRAFGEMFRVLGPGGRACILEFGSSREKIWGGLYNFYLDNVLPGIGRLIAGDKSAYAYLARTIGEFPPAHALAEEMENAGFTNVAYEKLTGGIVCLHIGQKSG